MDWEDDCTERDYLLWMESEEAKKIFNAGSRCQKRELCPYSEGSKEYHAWMQGWEGEYGVRN